MFIEDLFVVSLDTRSNIDYASAHISEHSPKYTIVKLKNRKKVIDIFTKLIYKIYGQNNNISYSEICCYNPTPLSSTIKEVFTNYDEVLITGKISDIDLIAVYDYLNDKNDAKNNINTSSSYNNSARNNSNNNSNTRISSGKYKILTEKRFKTEPIIGRIDELKELMIALASNNKSAILVGPSGVGKSVIVNELAYLIQNDNVPKFLKDKKIFKVNVSDFTAGTRYRGDMEERFNSLINTIREEDSILFIDEIHTIVGAGTTDGDKLNVSEMLKPVLDDGNIKVIGTTTNEEYNKFFETTALKRRFEKILIHEPDNILLSNIIRKTFIDYFNITNISALKIEQYLDIITEELINLTSKKNRTYNDIENNPSLVISIIDKAFAEAKLLDNEYLEIDNIIYGIKSCNRLYNTSKETTINNIINLNKTKPKTLSKVIELKNHM